MSKAELVLPQESLPTTVSGAEVLPCVTQLRIHIRPQGRVSGVDCERWIGELRQG